VSPALHAALVAEYRLPTTRIEFGAAETDQCFKCHGIPNFIARDTVSLVVRNLSVPPAAFKGSVHGKLACNQCHGDIRQYPHEFKTARPKVGCDADCHARDASGQPVRHEAQMAEFRRGAHSKGLDGGNPDIPACAYCHGASDPHAATRFKDVLAPRDRMALCADCHDDAQRMVRNKMNPEAVPSYRRSFHYKAIRFGSTKTAVCQDCHQVHRVIASRDTASSVSATHLAQTCGQEDCHEGARMNFAMSGANHLGLRVRRDPVLALWERFFVLISVGTLLVLGAGVAFDAQRRFWWLGRLLRRVAAGEAVSGRHPRGAGAAPAVPGERGRDE